MTAALEQSSGQESWPGVDLAALESAGFRYEIVAGGLHVVPPNNYWHQTVSPYTWQALIQAAPPGWLVQQERGVLCVDEKRIPDLVVFVPGAPTNLDWTPAEFVALVVEVESPSTRREDRTAKVLSYAEAGIPAYWRIERGPTGPVVHIYQPVGDNPDYVEVATVRPGQTHHVRWPFSMDICPDRLLGKS